jgi:hypothetical protein
VAELEKRLEDLSARVESRQQHAQAHHHHPQGLPPTPSDGGSPAAAAAAAAVAAAAAPSSSPAGAGGRHPAGSSSPSGLALQPLAKKQRVTWISDAPPPAFGYIFASEEQQRSESGSTAEDVPIPRRQHRSSHSPVVSHKTLGVATPVLWDDANKASRTSSASYNRRYAWHRGLPQVLDAAAASSSSSGAQGGGSKPGPEWPSGEEAELLLADYREHSE